MLASAKDVEIAGTRYQVSRFTARNGSWILLQIMTKVLPLAVEKQVNGDGTQLMAGRTAMTEEEFESLQAHCLAVCRRYEGDAPMPIFLRPNTWAVKELEYDLVTVMALTVHALMFNLSDFFGGTALKEAMQPLSDANLLYFKN